MIAKVFQTKAYFMLDLSPIPENLIKFELKPVIIQKKFFTL